LIGDAAQVLAEPWPLPESWKWAKMGDVTTIVGGGTPKTSEPAYFGGDIPWVTPADLSGYTDKYIGRGARNITEAGLANSGARLMPAGTVLFSSRAPIGYVAIASQAVATNQGFKSFVLKDELLPDFVYYWLQCAKPIAIKLASGTTFLEISGKKAAEIPVPVPPLDEQRRIVAEIEEQLSRLEAGVAALKRVQVNLKRYRTAVSDMAARPTTGRELKLLDLLQEGFKTGLSIKKSESAGVPSLKLSAIRNGHIDFAQSKLLPVSQNEVQDILLQRGDFLVIRGNGSIKLVGAGALVHDTPSPTVYPDLMIRVRVKPGIVEPRWLNTVWSSHVVRDQIERKAKTTAGIHKISQRDLGAITLSVPPIAEQQRIALDVERRLSVVEELETQVRADLARAERLRQAALARAFSIEK
jgi:type I restriction enzyme S subunit